MNIEDIFENFKIMEGDVFIYLFSGSMNLHFIPTALNQYYNQLTLINEINFL